MDANTNPFSQPVSTVSDVELISWVETSDKLVANGILSEACPILQAQRGTVTAEMRQRRLIGGPAKLTDRQQREMREGQE